MKNSQSIWWQFDNTVTFLAPLGLFFGNGWGLNLQNYYRPILCVKDLCVTILEELVN